MNTAGLSGAVISASQIRALSHPLAAASHYQWIEWEHFVLREPQALTLDGADNIVARALADDLGKVLEANARSVIAIVHRKIGAFAYTPRLELVVDRKLRQFTGWVNYAVTKTAADRERWLLQCRTPFLALAPEMQKSDYVEAEADLNVIAEAGGLVLAEDRPQFGPQTLRRLRRLRHRHSLGTHGVYRDYEQPWAGTCVGCHASWGMTS